MLGFALILVGHHSTVILDLEFPRLGSSVLTRPIVSPPELRKAAGSNRPGPAFPGGFGRGRPPPS
jgi:hypothetical protein